MMNFIVSIIGACIGFGIGEFLYSSIKKFLYSRFEGDNK